MRRIAKHSGAAVRAFHVKAFSCGGTAAPQLVSAQQLLQHVQDKIWHSSNSQLHAAKQALATHLVRSANLDLLEAEPDASSSVDLDPSRYQIPGPRAGQCHAFPCYAWHILITCCVTHKSMREAS